MRDWYRQLIALRKQGIAAGWLDVRNLATEHDLDHGLFRLIYRVRNQKVVICSRLAAPDAESITLRDVAPQEYLLDSRQGKPADSGEPCEFAPRHCRIWVEEIAQQ